jgi:hypothetical protein
LNYNAQLKEHVIQKGFSTLGRSSPSLRVTAFLQNMSGLPLISPLLVQDSGMDISKLVIPEVPIPARIRESKTASKKKQSKSSTSDKATRKKR